MIQNLKNICEVLDKPKNPKASIEIYGSGTTVIILREEHFDEILDVLKEDLLPVIYKVKAAKDNIFKLEISGGGTLRITPLGDRSYTLSIDDLFLESEIERLFNYDSQNK